MKTLTLSETSQPLAPIVLGASASPILDPALRQPFLILANEFSLKQLTAFNGSASEGDDDDEEMIPDATPEDGVERPGHAGTSKVGKPIEPPSGA